MKEDQYTTQYYPRNTERSLDSINSLWMDTIYLCVAVSEAVPGDLFANRFTVVGGIAPLCQPSDRHCNSTQGVGGPSDRQAAAAFSRDLA
jgi:hypothetical protein